VEAFDRADLIPGVSGLLKSVKVDIGDVVKKGQLLAEVEAPLLALGEKQAAGALKQAEGKIREAEALIAVAQAELQVAKGGVVLRQAEVDSAKANVNLQKAQLKRFKELLENKAIDVRIVDEKEAALAMGRGQAAFATAALENARGEVEVRQGKVVQAEATLLTARAAREGAEVALDKAKETLGLARVTAPFDGIVTQRNALGSV
jgi:multidrug resistance efflux pump